MMLPDQATLRDIRKYLFEELMEIYPEGESTAMVRMILEHTGYPFPAVIVNPGLKPGIETVGQINEIVSEIHTRRPIQYIMGYTHFNELRIGVNEHVLIPRRETEEMVWKIVSGTYRPPGTIIDLGTGSGCIALALKKHFPDSRVTGLDISPDALAVAEENGKALHLAVKWIQGDMLGSKIPVTGTMYELIVSNPPYVRDSEKGMMDRNVLDFEPAEALYVEDGDPLVYYRAIARFAAGCLAPEGKLWLEINEGLGKETVSLMKGSGFDKITLHKDMHEKERFIEAG